LRELTVPVSLYGPTTRTIGVALYALNEPLSSLDRRFASGKGGEHPDRGKGNPAASCSSSRTGTGLKSDEQRIKGNV